MEMISPHLLKRRQGPIDGGLDATHREEVTMHFVACATGVDEQTAHERTKAFFRSSGNDWALALS